MPPTNDRRTGEASASLASLQSWFSRAVSRPLLEDKATRPEGLEGFSLAEEARARVRAANGVDGLDRVSIYNRQYWFRLIDCLQQEYPCSVHVLGLDAFNGWVIRYLDGRPSQSPYLAELDEEFPAFLAKRDLGNEQDTVLEALRYDRAFSRAFDAPAAAPLRLEGVDQACLALAPHCFPLWLHWDFQSYRALCRADAELTAVFPLNAREHGVVVYRRQNILFEKPISREAFLLLDALRKPRTLSDLFAALEPRISAETGKTIERNLADWFREWVELGWLGAADPNPDL